LLLVQLAQPAEFRRRLEHTFEDTGSSGQVCTADNAATLAVAVNRCDRSENRIRTRSKMVGTTQLRVVIGGGGVAGLEALIGLRAHLRSNKRQSDAFGSER
jgi:NADH dehydrogenase FAD-containing subunit